MIFIHGKTFQIISIQSQALTCDSPADKDTMAEVIFPTSPIDVSKYSLVILPVNLEVTNLNQCLLESTGA